MLIPELMFVAHAAVTRTMCFAGHSQDKFKIERRHDMISDRDVVRAMGEEKQ